MSLLISWYISFQFFFLFLFNPHRRVFVLVLERERQRNVNGLPTVWALTGDQTRVLGMCPDWGWNLQPFGVQDSTPSN